MLFTADHGQVAVDPARVDYLEDFLPEIDRYLAHGPAGSARDVFLHAVPGLAAELAGELRERMAGRAEVLQVAELEAQGLFGEVGPRLRARLADVCVLPAPDRMAWLRSHAGRRAALPRPPRRAGPGGVRDVARGYGAHMSLRGGIDLGGTKIQAVVVDEEFQVLGEARVPTPTAGGPQDVAEAMAGALREAAEGHGDPVAIGVGSPGVIDEAAGVVSSARNLPGWVGSFPLAGALQHALRAPVVIGNDVNVATDAEFELGAAREFTSLLGVFWGTGVGGGIILDSKPWVGRGASGEIGHVVVEIGGARCPCGRRGCMEAYAGRGAMEMRARKLADEGRKTVLFEIMDERGRPRLTSGIWKRALERDDDLAHELVDRAVRALGAGVASAVQRARRRRRRDRRRARPQARRALRGAAPRGDAAAPVRLRTTARDPAGGAGRPRRRDRRGAALAARHLTRGDEPVQRRPERPPRGGVGAQRRLVVVRSGVLDELEPRVRARGPADELARGGGADDAVGRARQRDDPRAGGDPPRRDLRQPVRDPRQPPPRVDREDRLRPRQAGRLRERGVVGGQRPAGRVPGHHERVRAQARPPERDPQRREHVAERLPRRRYERVLVARVDDRAAAPREVLEPWPVEGGVGRAPAVQEHDRPAAARRRPGG